MALDENFAEAWLNCRHKVFGWTLKPLSLWHKLLIRASGLSLFDGDEDVTYADIYRVAYACRLTYPQTPKPQGRVSRWYHSVRLFLCDANKEASAFSDYINDYVTAPEFWSKEEASQGRVKGGAPEELSVVVGLMLQGFSEKEAWDMPLGKASWYSSAYAAWKGADLDFVTVKEREMQEQWKAMQEEMDAGAENFVQPESSGIDPHRFKPNGEPRMQ